MPESNSSEEKVFPMALSIAEPDEDQEENVQAMSMPGMPPATMGKLCRCNGKAEPPDQYLSSLGVRMLCRRPTDPEPSDEEMFSSAMPVFQDPNYFWTNHRVVDAYCADNPGANNNKFYLMSSWINMMMPGQPISERSNLEFKGKRVQSCETVIPLPVTAALSDDAAAESVAPVPGSVDSKPWDITGGYLEYRHLSVEQITGGNRLMRHGAPLRARRIAIAAFDVSWQYGPSPSTLISRSVGELASAPAGWLFMGLPKACLVVWQGDLLQRRVIISECRDKPDILSLDPNKPIFVQVNFAWANVAQRSGSFGVHVRVID